LLPKIHRFQLDFETLSAERKEQVKLSTYYRRATPSRHVFVQNSPKNALQKKVLDDSEPVAYNYY
jgi:hypothetical protein